MGYQIYHRITHTRMKEEVDNEQEMARTRRRRRRKRKRRGGRRSGQMKLGNATVENSLSITQ
jgi:hypothetical protein